jgi:hypothetical protein
MAFLVAGQELAGAAPTDPTVPAGKGIAAFSVQAVDSAGNRSPASSVTLTNTLTNQTC